MQPSQFSRRRDRRTTDRISFPPGRLTSDGTEAISIGSLELQGLDELTPRIAFDVTNHAAHARDLLVTIATETQTLWEHDVAIDGGAHQRVEWSDNLKEQYPAELSIRVSEPSNNTLHYALALPMHAQRLLELHVRTYPSLETARIEADLSRLEQSVSELRATLRVLEGDAVRKQHSFTPEAIAFDRSLDMSQLAPGDYRAVLEIRGAETDTDVLATVERSFTLQPLPDWHGNELGMGHDVPEPWTPLKLDSEAGRIACWGRAYMFADRPMLAQLTTGVQELFARPMSVLLETNGAQHDLNTLTAPMTIEEQRDEAEEVGPQHAEHLLGLLLLHDSQLWVAYIYDNNVLRTMYRAFAEYDFATGPYAFVPYWRQTITQPMDEDEDEAVVSFYVDQDQPRALMVLMNMSRETRSLAMEIDRATLGFLPGSVVNACHGERVAIKNGRVTIENLPSHVYRLLVLEP